MHTAYLRNHQSSSARYISDSDVDRIYDASVANQVISCRLTVPNQRCMPALNLLYSKLRSIPPQCLLTAISYLQPSIAIMSMLMSDDDQQLSHTCCDSYKQKLQQIALPDATQSLTEADFMSYTSNSQTRSFVKKRLFVSSFMCELQELPEIVWKFSCPQGTVNPI